MDERSVTHERGFTLIEIVIAAAIVATTVAAGVGVSLATRSFAVSAAATEFDQVLDNARTIAREVEGATLAFVPDAYGDGTEVRLLAGAGATLTTTTVPVLHARASFEEVESLHRPPFAFVVHVNGTLTGRPGFRVGDAPGATEIGCPSSGAYHFVISAAGGSAHRYVPCRITLAATGPVTLATWPIATPASSPTPCGGPCAPVTLPTAPSSSPSCPPNYDPTSGGCVPSQTPNPGPRYHVSVSLASPTVSVGASDSLTAQATLTNPSSVSAGAPASIPVILGQATSGICLAAPPGPQPSGATFTLTGVAAGTCTAVVQADLSAVPGATADTAPISVSVTGSPNATPSPSSCDLVTNGKCYRRIVDQTSQGFYKYVAPAISCDPIDPLNCRYVDEIRDINLGSSYVVQPASPPTDTDHELLFIIDKITTVFNQCRAFSEFANTPWYQPITWTESAIGAPVDASLGFGEPSMYIAVNHVISGQGATLSQSLAWKGDTILSGLWNAMAGHKIGNVGRVTYYSADAAKYIQWFPDFPGCDTAGDLVGAKSAYGIVTVFLTFEIFQATP